MEIFLNLAWVALSLVSVLFWLRCERRTGTERRPAMIALAMLLIILFPVISVSDDLWSIQNPAETDSCQRRNHNHIASCPHSPVPLLAAPIATLLALVGPEIHLVPGPSVSPSRAYHSPALDGIENRPPPAA
jgi:hypothetical protein